MDDNHPRSRPKFGAAVKRALLARCPNCGRGRLFASFLKPVGRCAVCGEGYGHIRSDDAAPWLTILAVGIVGVPIILTVESYVDWPTWVSSAVWPLFSFGLALVLLPRMKAVIISMIWLTHAEGSEME